MSLKRFPLIAFVLLACLIAGFIFLNKSGDRNSRSVILITIDTLRRDHLGCYGYARDTSPSIDKFAASAVVFDQAIAQSTVTLYSVPSFITSAFPEEHYKESKAFVVILNPQVETLPSILKKNNYKTCLITDQPLFKGKIKGLEGAFDEYIVVDTNNPQLVTRKALDWIAKNNKKKFFLWLYYLGAHCPYQPSSPYAETFCSDSFPKTGQRIPIAASDGLPKFGAIPPECVQGNTQDVDYYIAAYDGKIRVIDDNLGLLFRQFKDLGMDRSTAVVLIADHGESQGEHNLFFHHGNTLYDELLRVPMIVYYPGSRLKGARIKDQVQLLDVTPTVVDLMGIKDRSFTKDFEGISLKGYLLRGRQKGQDEVFSRWRFLWSIRTPEWKLIYVDFDELARFDREAYREGMQERYRDSYELYHLSSDPGETINLFLKEEGVFLKLKQKLQQHIAAMQKRVQENRKIFKKEDIESMRKTNGSLEKELKSLGYLQ